METPQSLIELVAGVLNVPAETLTLESGPVSLYAWDSLAHIVIVTAVEQAYDIHLTMPEILAIRTIGDFQPLLIKYGV